MPQRNEQDWLTSYLQLTENSEPSELYRLWSGISGIAACLQRKCFLNWHTEVYPGMYIILVGPSAARKTFAINQIEDIISGLPNVLILPDSITREAMIHTLADNTASILKDDGTSTLSSSATLLAGELAVFLKRGDFALLSFLTDIYDNKKTPWIYSTKGKGVDTINGVWLNILGALTPSHVRDVLPQSAGVEGGLTSRMIFVYAPGIEKSVSDPRRGKVNFQHQERLREDLEQVCMLSGEFTIEDDWVELWKPWYDDRGADCKLPQNFFGAYIERRGLHILKLSMIISVSESSDMVIKARHFQRALHYLTCTEYVMNGAFIQYGRADIHVILGKIMMYISTHGEVTYHKLMSEFIRDVTCAELDGILETLRRSGKYKNRGAIWYEAPKGEVQKDA